MRKLGNLIKIISEEEAKELMADNNLYREERSTGFYEHGGEVLEYVGNLSGFNYFTRTNKKLEEFEEIPQ